MPIVIKMQEEHGTEWLVSFTSHNPEAEDCVEMKDGKEAFKLVALIEKYC